MYAKLDEFWCGERSDLHRDNFERFGQTLSNRQEFAQVFPFILLTTTLIITIVKASLALSLGLVGALSIVRFRTPIKEPEELAYLFIAIGMGLGLGANQTIPTVVAGLTILGIMAALRWYGGGDVGTNLYLSIQLANKDGDLPVECLKSLKEITSRHAVQTDLRRYDLRDATLEATFLINLSDADHLVELTAELREAFPAIGVTFHVLLPPEHSGHGHVYCEVIEVVMGHFVGEHESQTVVRQALREALGDIDPPAAEGDGGEIVVPEHDRHLGAPLPPGVQAVGDPDGPGGLGTGVDDVLADDPGVESRSSQPFIRIHSDS